MTVVRFRNIVLIIERPLEVNQTVLVTHGSTSTLARVIDVDKYVVTTDDGLDFSCEQAVLVTDGTQQDAALWSKRVSGISVADRVRRLSVPDLEGTSRGFTVHGDHEG